MNLLKTVKMKKTDNTNVGGGIEQLKFLYIAGRAVKWHTTTLEVSLAVSCKCSHVSAI